MRKTKILIAVLLGLSMILGGVSACGPKEPDPSPKLTVTFSANGGVLNGDSTVSVTKGEEITSVQLPDATRDGYSFRGWYLSEDTSGDPLSFPYVVTETLVLYAGWDSENTNTKKYLYEAETKAVVTGVPSYGESFIEQAALASGGATLSNLAKAGNTITLTINADMAGKADLEFVLSSTNFNFEANLTVVDQIINPLIVKIELNGAELTYPDTTIEGSNQPMGFNLVFSSLIVQDVDLRAGANTIVLTAVGDVFPNFDCLYVHSSVVLDGEIDGEPPVDPVDNVYQGEVNFDLIVGAYPGGPAVEKAVLKFAHPVKGSSLSNDSFVVSHLSSGWFGPQVNKMTAKSTYLSDANGVAKTGAESNYVTIEYSTEYNGATNSFVAGNSAFVYVMDMQTFSGSNFWIDDATLSVALKDDTTITIGDNEYNKLNEDKVSFENFVIPSLEDWDLSGEHSYKDATYGDIRLKYGAYEPSKLSGEEKNPLIIWLHGAGEGGTDPSIAILGNEVTAIADDKIQSYFKSGSQTGAYVLAVQTPTMWMDNGTGAYGDGTFSKYTDALWSTIKAYVSGNSDIDTSRIYVGGCSNGGFMTMNMLINDDEGYFAAAYPICQAYSYAGINSDTKQKLAQKAIWFTQSENDPTVKPETTNALYVDLINLGANNVFYSYFSTVTLDGVNYNGHWSWIYTLKDKCTKIQPTAGQSGDLTVEELDTNSVQNHPSYSSMWEWIAAQSK